MALPQLKTATYLMNIPSTGKEVEFRPYTVKEEKVLMIAMESKDQRSITVSYTHLTLPTNREV